MPTTSLNASSGHERRDETQGFWESELEHIGSGPDWNPENADSAVDKVADLKNNLLANDRSGSNDQLFDRSACKILHQELNISPNLASSDGFWRWLAVEKFYDIVKARHSRRTATAGHMNFGIDGPPTSNRLRILWLSRGHCLRHLQ